MHVMPGLDKYIQSNLHYLCNVIYLLVANCTDKYDYLYLQQVVLSRVH